MDTPTYSIYKATNTVNGKVYIGFDSDWPSRKYAHIRTAKRESNLIFHKALRKYGPDAFVWEVICQSKDGQHLLKDMEPYFIKECNSFYQNGCGYNMTLGGEGVLGLVVSEETKQKQSERMKRHYSSPENRQKMSEIASEAQNRPEVKQKTSESMKRHWSSPENRQKASEINREAQNRPEVKLKHSERMKRHYSSPENRQKVREIMNRPEVKQKTSESMKRYYSSPDNRQKQSEINREILNRPEVKQKMSEGRKRYWSLPENRQKQCEGMKQYYANKRKSKPSLFDL